MMLADAIAAVQRGDTFKKSLTCSLQVELFDERGKRLATRHVTLFYQENKSSGDFLVSLMKLRNWELVYTPPLVDIVGLHLLSNNMLSLVVQFGTHALFFHKLWQKNGVSESSFVRGIEGDLEMVGNVFHVTLPIKLSQGKLHFPFYSEDMKDPSNTEFYGRITRFLQTELSKIPSEAEHLRQNTPGLSHQQKALLNLLVQQKM